MNKRPLMIGLLALGGVACEQRADGPAPSAGSAPATAPATGPAAQADTFDARETRLVTLKLPGMV